MEKIYLPKTIEPIKGAQRKKEFEGIIPSQFLIRLNEIMDNSDIHVTLQCDYDIRKVVYIKGKITTSVSLHCQRCLKKITHPIEIAFCYMPSNDEYDIIPEGYEEIELDEKGYVNLYDLIEDEILLSLPMIPLHKPEECHSPRFQFGHLNAEAIAKAEEKDNPFSVLSVLKK